MARRMMKLICGGAIAGLLAAGANAQPHSPIEIEQLQTGSLWSEMDVHVDQTASEASTAATTVGNTAAGLVTKGNVTFKARQEMQGDASASARMSGYAVTGTATAATTSYGNAASGGTWNGNTAYRAEQLMSGDTSARTQIDLQGVDRLGVATTAIANVSAPTAEHGDNRAFQEQRVRGSVEAVSDVDLCCNGSDGTVVTTAGGNAVSSTGSSAYLVNGAVQSTGPGETIRALGNVYAGDATNMVAATTATGNSYTVSNEWGFTSLGREGSELYQGNQSEIDAQTWVTYDELRGTNAATAYGVGNSALVSNTGADTQLYAIQENYATVGSQVSFTGTSTTGGVAIASATSIGNAATVSLCNVCGDASVGGALRQVNQGSVYAIGQMAIGAGASVHGAATAVGNSATYQSGGH
jgi:hypothetical protein